MVRQGKRDPKRTGFRPFSMGLKMVALLAALMLTMGTVNTVVGQAVAPTDPIQNLNAFLKDHSGADWNVDDLKKQSFATVGLDREQAKAAGQLLVEHHARWVRENRAAEMEERLLKMGDQEMPFWYKVYGEKPADGRSLFISMHGGGGAPKKVNDQQWNNQKRLYQPEEGVYVAPRAPVDAWNMWHVASVDSFFQRLIENMIVFEGVNPNKVYLMGYSAGGDGVYQIAPRWADHLAAAAMMAGHPNETTPDGLRNLPFILQMGGKDGAYKRNQIAAEWETKLAALQKDDAKGYPHKVIIYPDYGHWMQGEDKVALPWMVQYERDLFPDKIVWKQDDVTHQRFYWISNEDSQPTARSRVVVLRDGQQIRIAEVDQVESLGLLLDDRMPGLSLDQAVRIEAEGKTWEEKPVRSIGTLAETLWQRGDPAMMVSSKLVIDLPKTEGSNAPSVEGE